MGFISDSENTVQPYFHIPSYIAAYTLNINLLCFIDLICSAVMNILRFFRFWRYSQHIVVCQLR